MVNEMLYTTINKLKDHPNINYIECLRSTLPADHGDDDQIGIDHIVRSIGLSDAIRSLISCPIGIYPAMILAVDFAEILIPVYKLEYPKDKDAVNLVRKARSYLRGDISSYKFKEFKSAFQVVDIEAIGFLLADLSSVSDSDIKSISESDISIAANESAVGAKCVVLTAIDAAAVAMSSACAAVSFIHDKEKAILFIRSCVDAYTLSVATVATFVDSADFATSAFKLRKEQCESFINLLKV